MSCGRLERDHVQNHGGTESTLQKRGCYFSGFDFKRICRVNTSHGFSVEDVVVAVKD